MGAERKSVLRFAPWVVIAVFAVIIGLILYSRSTAEEHGGRSTGTSAATEQAELPSFGTPAIAGAIEAAAPRALGETIAESAPAAAPGATSLRVRVIWAADKSPAAGIGLQVFFWGAPGGGHRNLRLATTDAHGEWFASPVPTGNVAAYTDRDKAEGTKIEPGQAALIEIALPPGFNVSGVVKDAQGAPVADADVWMSMAQNDREGQVVTRSDAQGRFALRDLRVGGRQVLAARSSTHAPSPTVGVEGKLGETEQIVLVLGGDCGAIRGVVVDPGGAPVPGARVRIGRDAGFDVAARSRAPAFDLRCDAQGTFLAEGLPVGAHEVTAAAPGWSPTDRATGMLNGQRVEMYGVPVAAGQIADVTLQLQPSASLSGTARDENGQPVYWAAISTVDVNSYLELMSAETNSGEDGHYELRDLPLGIVNLQAEHEKAGRATTHLKFEAGQALTWDPQITFGGRLAGTLLDARGQPAAKRHLSTLPADRRQPERGSADTDASGHFAMRGLSLGPQDIFVAVPGVDGTITLASGVAVGQTDLVLRLPEGADSPTGVVGRVVDPFGRPASGFKVWIEDSGSQSMRPAKLEDGTGRFMLDGLAAGQYFARVEADPAPRVESAPLTVTGGQTGDFGDLVLAPGGRVSVLLAAPGEIVEQRMYANLVAETSNHGFQIRRDGERWVSTRAPAGRYTLILQSMDFAAVRRPVVIEDGRDTLVEVSLQSGIQQALRILGTVASSGDTTFALSIRSADGDVAIAYPPRKLRPPGDPTVPNQPAYERTYCLAPGAYLVDVTLGDKSKTAVAFSTSPNSPWEIDLR